MRILHVIIKLLKTNTNYNCNYNWSFVCVWFVWLGCECVVTFRVRGVSWSEVATVPKRKSHRGLDLDLSLNSEVNIRKGWKENGGTK